MAKLTLRQQLAAAMKLLRLANMALGKGFAMIDGTKYHHDVKELVRKYYNEPEEPGLFYLQRSDEWQGNFLVWWAVDGGYTSMLHKAHKFTLHEAESAIKYNRDVLVAWPCDLIDNHPTATVLAVHNEPLRFGVKADGSASAQVCCGCRKGFAGINPVPQPAYCPDCLGKKTDVKIAELKAAAVKCNRCKTEPATTKYSDLDVCAHCEKMLNDEFDEEYR